MNEMKENAICCSIIFLHVRMHYVLSGGKKQNQPLHQMVLSVMVDRNVIYFFYKMTVYCALCRQSKIGK